MSQLPNREVQYVTREGDVLDALCWQYYGTSRVTTERTLARNRFLTRYSVSLPAGLIITFPIVAYTEVFQTEKLWNYAKTLGLSAPSSSSDYATSLQDALDMYRRGRIASGVTTGTGTTTPTTPATEEPLTLSNAQWLAVYYQSGDEWKLGKVDKSLLITEYDDTGVRQRLLTLEDFRMRFEQLRFLPEGSASLQIDSNGRMTILLDKSVLGSSQQDVINAIKDQFPVRIVDTCNGLIEVLGPLP